jgi:hypothetical protein
MRLFLHLKDGEALRADPDGQEFSTLEEAASEAAEAARSIMAEAMRHGQPLNARRSFPIADAAGVVLLTVQFADTIIW